MDKKARIIFYGTPDFAVASLESLADEGFEVAAVVTAPDKPAGRGLKLSESPVKVSARSRNIPVLQPVSMKSAGFLEEIHRFSPDLQVVVAFRMMPKEVWSLPPLGTFNLHASLLPQYRGAAPINWAIINGETETGVTTFFLQEQIDTGNVIFSEKTRIGPDETAGELHDRLKVIGARLVVKTALAAAEGIIRTLPQTDLHPAGEILKPAPKFTRADARIDLKGNCTDVYNLIRGMSPYPGAYTDIPLSDGSSMELKILRAFPDPEPGVIFPTVFQTDRRTFLRMGLKDGSLLLTEVQPAGKKVMKIGEFLNGYGRLIS